MDKLSAPSAPRSVAHMRLRFTEDDKDDQPDEKKIKGQRLTGTSTGTGTTSDYMEVTMDRHNDPGGSSSSSPIII
eukprot:16278236-Heterocapsa_arctica.AAC.1